MVPLVLHGIVLGPESATRISKEVALARAALEARKPGIAAWMSHLFVDHLSFTLGLCSKKIEKSFLIVNGRRLQNAKLYLPT